jgi:hypothetical protein
LIKIAAVQEERANTAPLERSIPPVMITMVMPTPKIFRIAACLRILMMLDVCRKWGLINEIRAHKARSIRILE